MRYIKDIKDGYAIQDVYLCKTKNSATTKNGKEYLNVILGDKTGNVDCKIWNADSAGISDFEPMDYVFVNGEAKTFNGNLQIDIRQIRKADESEYNLEDFIPTSKQDVEVMYDSILKCVSMVENNYLHALLEEFFVNDQDFIVRFKKSSAAKSIHHNFAGGLVEHTLGVARLCSYYCKQYPVLNKDLLLTAALCHDIGKIYEYSPFPENDYTDEGNLLGHIVMGIEMVGKKIDSIPDFPKGLANELKHCIAAHHGKLEFGSPKRPGIIEAVALSYADDTDAKMQSFIQFIEDANTYDWSYSKAFDGSIRMTKDL
ncbi:MAG: HD domain-containing protein [Lachnospiraceae bacterium]|nr:HD domain-containing protein [Lachnospiraceae bacterium]MBP5564826.1 HD domain-containing protein [Lachnospiraceae bacterium]